MTKTIYTQGKQVGSFNNWDELRIGANHPAFIWQGDKLVYPNPILDGLVLWFDFSGMTNSDTNRGIATDLSGNGNHGTLQNFNFTSESGYDKNKLLFDGVDDYINLPEGIISGNLGFTFEIVVEFDSFENAVWANFMSLSNSHALMIRHSRGLGWYIDYVDSKAYIVNSNFLPSELPLGVPLYISYVSEFIGGGKAKTTFIVNEKSEQFIHELSPRFDGFKPVEIGSSASNRKMKFKNKSAKFYNRPLTPEEIAHNYEIEKERFGIE